MVERIYVEKKTGFDVQAASLAEELRTIVGIRALEGVRLFIRYDVEGISAELFEECVPIVFSEPQVDVARPDLPSDIDLSQTFAVEYLPGQFDQRAASAQECIQLISQGELPSVRSAVVYALQGAVEKADIEAVKHYVINPVEAREASLERPETLERDYPEPADVEVLEGFTELDEAGIEVFVAERGLAMDVADLAFCQRYFQSEGRQPTITEIKVIDTYWSDHCRHTTFNTRLDNIIFHDDLAQRAFENYCAAREELGRADRPISLMDMGTIGARYLKAKGIIGNIDESDEVNACTVKVTADVNGTEEPWLLLFKNETHNHPTEIEPFGGAATCIGGAIRDPLSGRSYVYQAMRVTGAADPLVPLEDTLPGKLPQRKLVTEAAQGYSSYGNQIGLATGQVSELYHAGYAAKRMEIGAVVGATPESYVRREEPTAGDVVLLLGGRTGRDGIGGATGSSKAHSVSSLETCGAEVQKGNAPEERKIQRLFRDGEACRLIKRCNDFGAGGVSVAVGELASGLLINLDAVPKKYDGLDGTELAISESQERMAVALAAGDVEEFVGLAHAENLEVTPIATVTDDNRVRMMWRGKPIVDISREFLASNGAPKHAQAEVEEEAPFAIPWQREGSVDERLDSVLTDLNVASNKGLAERFDSTVGSMEVLMPFGGARQLTPPLAMASLFPVLGKTSTASGMAWGFNPYLSSASPFVGAYLAVVESIARLIGAGFERSHAYFTFQEYFERLRNEPLRWGKPVAALLGALQAQMDVGVGAIGGKDSMSGSFEHLDVPPTLVSFAVAAGSADRVISPELKEVGSRIVWLRPKRRSDAALSEACGSGCEKAVQPSELIPSREGFLEAMGAIEALIGNGRALAVSTPGYGGVAEALFKMGVGNGVGIDFAEGFTPDELFSLAYGSYLVELAPDAPLPSGTENLSVIAVGTSIDDYLWHLHGDHEEVVNLELCQEKWEARLEPVFPYRTPQAERETLPQVPLITHAEALPLTSSVHIAHPRVVIPVFPGTNCEYETAEAFRQAGAIPEIVVIANRLPQDVSESAARLVKAIKNSQIVMIPGGFSGGDEPDGAAKFITAFFRAPVVTEAVRDLLQQRDGLMLGVCNGFQALVKLGLVPYGDILPMDASCPTLTFNNIGRHQSRMVNTRVASGLSPWLALCQPGDIHTIPISHGEGRFVASGELLEQMRRAGQIATQYVDADGVPSMDLGVNPNGSMWAIEGITSPDGRVLGKMGHSERRGKHLYKNIPGNCFQPLYEGGVNYFL